MSEFEFASATAAEQRLQVARARLRKLVATFPQPGPNDLHGEALIEEWVQVLAELPPDEREEVIAEYGSRYRVAAGLDVRA